MNKRKLQPISYGVTKTEASFQVLLAECMGKLVEGIRQNNMLLKELIKKEQSPNKNKQNIVDKTPQSQAESNHSKNSLEDNEELTSLKSNPLQQLIGESTKSVKKQFPVQIEQKQEVFRMSNVFQVFQNNMREISEANKLIVDKISDMQSKTTPIKANKDKNEEKSQGLQQMLLNVIQKKDSKKGYESYGIISEVMPFSDKREIKVRYKITDLLESGDGNIQNMNLKEWKSKITEWIGMVFRATASICWNMLLNDSLNFEEVKILFTQNIIFNYIELMQELAKYFNEETSLPVLDHINIVSCEVLEYLCKQYPQTKIEAPNISLKNAIPTVQNQGQAKCDLISMVCKENKKKNTPLQRISFELRQDKDYSSAIMKTINYIIEKTQEQYDPFQKIMSCIFQKIFLHKQKRNKLKILERYTEKLDSVENQFRQKVKRYSYYAIGRKVPKNIPKYTDLEIQYGVFFVKAPSILRIITKWLEQLYDFVSNTEQNITNITLQLKDHNGKVVTMSKRVRTLLFQSIWDRLPKIKQKTDKIKQECYLMQYVLTGQKYIMDAKQMHLSEDQLSIGKFCSNLKNAISSYVCSQLSKIIYYLQLIPKQTDPSVLEIADEDFEDQAMRHLKAVNLVSLKIFDLLRCKCHSNEEEIIWIVQALKQLEKEDSKFQILRVKDRLNLGTRDILINAQYDGGLVWQIQLAVTSNVEKKQGLLDKYNHFLYELKRAKLGPLSECATIWTSLEQKSLYFQQIMKKKEKIQAQPITHKSKDCKINSIADFTQFKRPIICFSCKEYFSIPTTSLLNIRCEQCKITYCGICFYSSLNSHDKKRFMFQNYQLKKLMTKGAFDQLQQYTDFKKPFPKQGFFIKKKFLNRELSFFTVVALQKNKLVKDEIIINLSQTVLRNDVIDCRAIHKNQISVKEINGEYFLQSRYKELNDFWIFYFPNKKLDFVTLQQLQAQMKQHKNFGSKYLNVLEQPNYMNELNTIKKSFEKARLINGLKMAQDPNRYQIGVYRFNNFNILAKYEIKPEELKDILIKKINKSYIKKFFDNKGTIVNLQQKDISNQFDLVLAQKNPQFFVYLQKVQKVFLADNLIQSLVFLQKFTNLQYISISKNYIKSLKGIQNLKRLQYVKLDQNQITSLEEFSELTELNYISANFNRINSLKGVEHLINLERISLCSNKLQSVNELSSLNKLQKVYLRQNPIKDCLPLCKLHMKHLFLGQTLIDPTQLLTYTFVQKLHQISLKGNKLKSIPKIFDKMVNLTQLKLNKNEIKKIENLDALQKLTLLDLNDNQIQRIENMSCLISIEEIKLKNNKITVIQGVKGYIQTLRRINLQQNPLDDLSQYLLYEDKPKGQMRLKFTEKKLSEKAANQLKNHAAEVNNKSEGDD